MSAIRLKVAIVAVLGVSLFYPIVKATTYQYDTLHRLTNVTYNNGNSITYSYDSSGNRTQRVAVVPRSPADFDRDGDVDMSDFGHLQVCLGGPAVGTCADANLNGVGGVDQADVTVFLRCMRGPNVPADPNCAK